MKNIYSLLIALLLLSCNNHSKHWYPVTRDKITIPINMELAEDIHYLESFDFHNPVRFFCDGRSITVSQFFCIEITNAEKYIYIYKQIDECPMDTNSYYGYRIPINDLTSDKISLYTPNNSSGNFVISIRTKHDLNSISVWCDQTKRVKNEKDKKSINVLNGYTNNVTIEFYHPIIAQQIHKSLTTLVDGLNH